MFLIVLFVILGVVLLFYRYGPNDSVAITSRAIAEKKVQLCDSIRSPGIGIGGETEGKLISMCYEKYAEAFPRQQVCAGFLPRAQTGNQTLDNWEYIHYSQCVQGEAQSQDDANICLQIGDQKSRSYCVATVGMKNKDKTICNILPNQSDKNLCLSQF